MCSLAPSSEKDGIWILQRTPVVKPFSFGSSKRSFIVSSANNTIRNNDSAYLSSASCKTNSNTSRDNLCASSTIITGIIPLRAECSRYLWTWLTIGKVSSALPGKACCIMSCDSESILVFTSAHIRLVLQLESLIDPI